MTTQPTTVRTYTARAPEVPPAQEGEYETRTVYSNQSLSEQAHIEGTDRPSAVRRRTVPAEPTATAPGGDLYWPLWVDTSTGEPCHPAVLAHDIGTGAAQLAEDVDPAEVHRITEWLRRTALVSNEDAAALQAPIAVEWRVLKERAAAQLEEPFLPDGSIKTYTRSELAEMFKVDARTLHRWAVDGRFPRPIAGLPQDRWDARVIHRFITGTTPQKPKQTFDFESAGASS